MEGRRVRFLLLIPVFSLILMTQKARSQNTNPPGREAAASKSAAGAKSASKNLTSAASAWVESTLRKMTVDEKIGLLLFTTYHGSLTSTDSPAYEQLLRDVQDLHVGGFIVVTHGSPLGIVKSQAYPTAVLADQQRQLGFRLQLVRKHGCRIRLALHDAQRRAVRDDDESADVQILHVAEKLFIGGRVRGSKASVIGGEQELANLFVHRHFTQRGFHPCAGGRSQVLRGAFCAGSAL